LRPVASNEYLAGGTTPAAGRPLEIRLFVDFRDGAGPQAFDFAFANTDR
jgi:hypothetical protein